MEKQINHPKTLQSWLKNLGKQFFIFLSKKLLWLFFNLYLIAYYIIYIIVQRIINRKTPNQVSLIQFALNWSVPIIFGFLIFYNFSKTTFHSLIFGDIPTSLPFILTKSVIENQLNISLFYGMIATGICFSIINCLLFLLNSESLGSIILNRRLIKKNDNEINFITKLSYILISALMIATIFIWPVFFAIWSLSLCFRIIFNESILNYIFKLKFQNNNDKTLLNNQPKTINWHKVNIKKKEDDLNSYNCLKIKQKDQEIEKTILSKKYKILTVMPKFINLIIYYLFIFFSCLSIELYKFVSQQSNRLFSFLQYYFTGTINNSGKNDFLVGTLNLFRKWIAPDGSVLTSFYGSAGTLNYDFNSTHLSLIWIANINSWSQFWGDVQYIIFCIIINYQLSPGPMIALLLLAGCGLYFVINLLTIWIWGNTILGFLFTGKHLISKNTNKSLTIGGRSWYLFTYIIWLVLFFVPIVNIIWIISNFVCYFVHQENIVDVMNDTYFGKNKYIEEERVSAVKSAYKTFNGFVSKFRIRDIDSDSVILDFNQKTKKSSSKK